MAPLRVMLIVGTRPEAIKMAPVYESLKKRLDRFDVTLVLTAQHRTMLDQVLALFGMTATVDLNLMRENQSPTEVAASVLKGIDEVLRRLEPDWVVVQGDTTTVAAAAWAAFHRKIPVAHVEAGLRTRDRYQPFPEEINRRLVGVLAEYHFAPTIRARDNLLQEGVPGSSIFVTGNTVIDALFRIASGPRGDHPIWASLPDNQKVILVTAHRRENFGEPLNRIFGAIRDLADRYQDRVVFVYPVHLNPRVRKPAFEHLGHHPAIRLIDPVDYRTLVHLMKRSVLILTDSGGIQEEAPALGVPVLVLRNVTERPEAVEAGVVRLVGSDPDRICSTVQCLLEDPDAYHAMARGISPYGDGRAAQRITAILANEPWEPFRPVL